MQNIYTDPAAFVNIILKYPIFMAPYDPTALVDKAQAMKELKIELEDKLGLIYEDVQILSKLNKIKNTIRKKITKHVTRKTELQFRKFELKLLQLMPERNNPFVRKYLQKRHVAEVNDDEKSINSPKDVAMDSNSDKEENISSTDSQVKAPKNILNGKTTTKSCEKCRKTEQEVNAAIASHETQETKNLSTSELQRLVLLQQFKFFNVAEEFLKVLSSQGLQGMLGRDSPEPE